MTKIYPEVLRSVYLGIRNHLKLSTVRIYIGIYSIFKYCARVSHHTEKVRSCIDLGTDHFYNGDLGLKSGQSNRLHYTKQESGI